MVDDIGPPFSRFRLDVASSVVGAVAAATLLGLIAWGVGLQLGLGYLDARTRALDAGLEQMWALIRDAAAVGRENAAQITALGQKTELLNASIASLRDAISADAARAAEGRQADREDLRELRELTRENSLAIRDLLNLRRRDEASGAPTPG